MDSTNICPKCGTSNADIASFCGACGTPLATAKQMQPPTQESEPARGKNYQKTYNYDMTQPTVPPGGPVSGGMIPPRNYMVESIIVTILSFFCCSSPISGILGIIAIVKASEVHPLFMAGKAEASVQKALTAKKLLIGAVAIIVIFFIASIVVFLYLLLKHGGMDGFQELVEEMKMA